MQRNIVIGWKDRNLTYEDTLEEELRAQEARINAALYLSSQAAKAAAMAVVAESSGDAEFDLTEIG